jgi:hypothetical protein
MWHLSTLALCKWRLEPLAGKHSTAGGSTSAEVTKPSLALLATVCKGVGFSLALSQGSRVRAHVASQYCCDPPPPKQSIKVVNMVKLYGKAIRINTLFSHPPPLNPCPALPPLSPSTPLPSVYQGAEHGQAIWQSHPHQQGQPGQDQQQ